MRKRLYKNPTEDIGEFVYLDELRDAIGDDKQLQEAVDGIIARKEERKRERDPRV